MKFIFILINENQVAMFGDFDGGILSYENINGSQLPCVCDEQ